MHGRYPILEFFAYTHLPTHLQPISEPFSVLAHQIAQLDGASTDEVNTALRKLLECKDAAVRAAIRSTDEQRERFSVLARPATVRARFTCSQVEHETGADRHDAEFSVTRDAAENAEFFGDNVHRGPDGRDPVGAIVLGGVANPAWFQPGDEYHVDFTPCA